MTTAATNYVYLTDSGTLTVNTSGWPASTNIVRLAVVVAGATTITSVTDARIAHRSEGTTTYLALAGGGRSGAGTVRTKAVVAGASGADMFTARSARCAHCRGSSPATSRD